MEKYDIKDILTRLAKSEISTNELKLISVDIATQVYLKSGFDIINYILMEYINDNGLTSGDSFEFIGFIWGMFKDILTKEDKVKYFVLAKTVLNNMQKEACGDKDDD